MVQIFIGENAFELISYPTQVSNRLNFSMYPGNLSFSEIMNLISSHTGDYIIKSDGEIVARYTNFTELVVIEQSISEGATIVRVGLEHPIVEQRFELIEAQLTSHSTNIENLDGSVSNLNGEVSGAKTSITVLQSDMTQAQSGIVTLGEGVQEAQSGVQNVSSALSTTNQNVATIDNTVNTQGEALVTLKSDLDTTKDAVDYLIMKG